MTRVVIAWSVALFAAVSPAAAQVPDASPRPEVRVDAIVAARSTSVQGGLGLQVPVGYYARIGIDAAVGADVQEGYSRFSGRLDGVARFLFDPFRQSRWALSAGGGVSLRAREKDRVRPYLLGVVDLEGPRMSNGFTPAFQLGLGGGVRMGLVLRWADLRVR